jgi:hypothetical protein
MILTLYVINVQGDGLESGEAIDTDNQAGAQENRSIDDGKNFLDT